jgi:alginate O-acetyltransferase complex protein AlgJ
MVKEVGNTLMSLQKIRWIKMIRYILIFSGMLTAAIFADPYKELVPNFQRTKTMVTVREIDIPTFANLDYAAYDRNPVLNEVEFIKKHRKPAATNLQDITFESIISDIKDGIAETPLTVNERQRPLAWKPLLKKAWTIVKDDKLQQIAGKINSYKWADPTVFQAYQEVTTAYIHESNDSITVWVKIEFAHWVTFLPSVTDEDNDGIKEIYGKLDISAMSSDSLSKMIRWIKNDYSKTILDKQQIIDWVTDLASYWYPTKNTDIVSMDTGKKWPDENVNKKVIKQLKGLVVNNPLAVVEGKPFSPDKPIYNVYIVNNKHSMNIIKDSAVTEQSDGNNMNADTSVSENFKKNMERFSEEIKQNGSYDLWAAKNEAFRKSMKSWLTTFPQEQFGLEGVNGWLFFRKSFDYLLGGDLSKQATEYNPLPHITQFSQYLKKYNVNLLVVVVPNKEEIYFDKVDKAFPEPAIPMLNPYSRKILKDLQDNGVEVIDLLSSFLDSKTKDKSAKEFLYQEHDTHWTMRGIEIASTLISDRIKKYSWYDLIPEKNKYTLTDTSFERLGDIVERIPEVRQAQYKPSIIRAQQVIDSEGKLFNGNNGKAPIMLIGDSFTGVFESVDCKGAGVGAHIAYKTDLPLDIITSWGGGPLVRKKAMRVREKDLSSKKLVIYMMVARDLYNYSQKWESFP